MQLFPSFLIDLNVTCCMLKAFISLDFIIPRTCDFPYIILL